MQQQTAIEWLHEIAKQREPDKFDWEEAKRMEENQSDADYQRGFSDGYSEGYDKGMSDYSRF